MTVEEAYKKLVKAWHLPNSERHIFEAGAKDAMLAAFQLGVNAGYSGDPREVAHDRTYVEALKEVKVEN